MSDSTVIFETCPPVAWGVCMRDHGNLPSMCAMSATCCVKARVSKVDAADPKAARADARWKRERIAA